MRITFITTSFHPKKGGVEKHVLSVAYGLIARGHSVRVLTPRVDQATDQQLFEGIEVSRFRAVPFFTAWFSLWRFRNIIRESDIVHLHDFPTYIWAWPYLALYRKKFFVTFHGWEGRIPPHPFFIKLRRMVERKGAGSIAVGDYIAKWYGQHPTIVLYGGVTRDSIVPLRMSSPNDHLKLLFLGRLATDTGILRSLEFFKRILALYPRASCTIVGDGPSAPIVKQYIKNKNLYVELHGWVSNPQNYLERSDVVVTTGYLGILEAFAAGATVCSLYDNDLKRDYIRMSPFSKLIVHAETAEELAQQYHALHSHRDAEMELRTAARSFVLDHTWDDVVTSYEQLWGGASH